jgi:ABC-type glycerol-3-phosphate transport system substrate-binding protein
VKKKLFFLVLVVLCLTGMLFANSEAETDVVEITQWQFPFSGEAEDLIIFDELREDFSQLNPNVKVNIEFFPWGGRRERMQTALISGAGPDVVYLNDDMKPLFNGYFLDMNEYLTPEDREDFTASSLEWSSYDGTLCYLPVLVNSVAHFYNMDILEAAGIPEEWVDQKHTWEDFTDFNEKVMKAGYTPYMMGPADASIVNELSNWLSQGGAAYYNDDKTKCTLDTPEAIKTFNYLKSLWDKGYINQANLDKSQKETTESFPVSQVACIMAQNQLVAQFKTLYPDLDMNIKLGYPLEDVKISSNGTIAGYGSFNTTKHPAEAAAWIKTITGNKGMLLIDKALGFIPTRKSVGKVMAAEMNDSTFDRAVENSQWFVPTVPASPIGSAANEIIKSAFQEILLDVATVEDSLSRATDSINKMLDNYYEKIN